MLASSAYFTNVFRGHYERPRVDASISLSLAADDVFPVRGKLKYVGPSLNSLSRFSENLRKSLYKIENSGNL